MECLGAIGDFCNDDDEKINYTHDASRCLAILIINTSRLFIEDLVIPPEHRLMLVNFHRECIGNTKKSPVGPSQKPRSTPNIVYMFLVPPQTSPKNFIAIC